MTASDWHCEERRTQPRQTSSNSSNMDVSLARHTPHRQEVSLDSEDVMGSLSVNTTNGTLAPSLCISYTTKSDIHGIIMNPSYGWGYYFVEKKVIQSSYNTKDKRT